jgi:hypothetical protein
MGILENIQKYKEEIENHQLPQNQETTTAVFQSSEVIFLPLYMEYLKFLGSF